MTHPIPQPRRIPFLGNITSIDKEAPTNSYMLLYQQYGEIFRLDLVGAFEDNLVMLKREFLTGLENLKIEESLSSAATISFTRFVTTNASLRQ